MLLDARRHPPLANARSASLQERTGAACESIDQSIDQSAPPDRSIESTDRLTRLPIIPDRTTENQRRRPPQPTQQPSDNRPLSLRVRIMSKRAAHAQQLPPPPQHAAIPCIETSQALEAAQRELRRVQTVRPPWLLMMIRTLPPQESKLRPSLHPTNHTTTHTHTRSCKPRRSRGSAPRTPRCRPGR